MTQAFPCAQLVDGAQRLHADIMERPPDELVTITGGRKELLLSEAEDRERRVSGELTHDSPRQCV